MTTHDPRDVVEKLRNHLAAPDGELSFLFGAGTSCSINIAPPAESGQKRGYEPLVPSIATLTSQCKSVIESYGTGFKRAWNLLEAQCSDMGKIINIENIISAIQAKIDAIGKEEKLVGLDKDELIRMEQGIRGTIAATVIVDEDRIPDIIPHMEFATWIKSKTGRAKSLEIFTTNYDILFERALESAQVPFFDGFVGSHEPFFYTDAVDRDELLPGYGWVRLWKIHGSVNWEIIDHGGFKRIARTHQKDTGQLILPSHRKYDESRKQPYVAMIDRLSRILNREYSLLITCGYSFNDEHINSIILSILDNSPTSNVISLQFGELSPDDKLVKWAEQKKNLTIIGKNAGVLGGRYGKWRLTTAVDGSTCLFMDMAFDSNALIPPEIQEPGATAQVVERTDIEDPYTGNMRLGDFTWFCKFLNTMERSYKEER